MQSLLFLIVCLGVFVCGSTFEPSNFDVTRALKSHGVDMRTLDHQSVLSDQCSCSNACSTLNSLFGSDNLIPISRSTYTTFQDAYWSSIQTDVSPQCIFLPPDAEAVAVLVLLSRLTRCPFAVKSGGHSAFAGAASSPGGITVDLRHLNGISLSADQAIAYVEPGNTWMTVYSKLAESEVTVVGGRVANIGVGGLTLGGGISFFSGFHGWAVDNVEQYEVVTANGKMINASVSENPDLYWALRGGGNNFGIVTKFHLRTIPIPGNVIWGGARLYLESSFPAVVNAATNIALNSPSDPRAGYWAAFGAINGTKFSSCTLWYSNATNINNTKMFDEFNKIQSVRDAAQERNLVEFVEENQGVNPLGKREVYSAITVKVSAKLMQYAVDSFYEALPSVADIAGINMVVVVQAITTPQIINMAQNGGNPLGLDPNEGPFFLVEVACWWLYKQDDTRIYSWISDYWFQLSAKAKDMGLQNDYIYMNYASQFQDVIRGYGSKNKARLIEIAKMYDPQGVFQTLQPGYFKLERAPVESNYFSGMWSEKV